MTEEFLNRGRYTCIVRACLTLTGVTVGVADADTCYDQLLRGIGALRKDLYFATYMDSAVSSLLKDLSDVRSGRKGGKFDQEEKGKGADQKGKWVGVLRMKVRSGRKGRSQAG